MFYFTHSSMSKSYGLIKKLYKYRTVYVYKMLSVTKNNWCGDKTMVRWYCGLFFLVENNNSITYLFTSCQYGVHSNLC